MKLTELEPKWTQAVMMKYGDKGQSNFAPADFINGVSFLCPHCRQQRLAISFEPPLGPTSWINPNEPVIPPENLIWKRESGDTFETLTMSPSLDFSQQGRIDFAGHWHGFIKNGEVS